MNSERYSGTAFNPDGPTAEADQPTRRYDRTGRPSQRQPAVPAPYNPDAPTADDGEPAQRNNGGGWRQPAMPASYNPDAPTAEDRDPQGDSRFNRSQSNNPPFRKMSFNPDSPTAEENSGIYDESSQSSRGNSGASTSNLPFKPMNGSGKRGGRVPEEDSPYERKQPQNPKGGSQPLQSRRTTSPVLNSRDDNSYHPRVEPDSISGITRIRPDSHSLTLGNMQKLEDLRYENEMNQYRAKLSKWKNRLWIPVVLAIVIVVMILLAGAFAGTLGIITIILIAGITAAILAVTGKMEWLKKPRKPKKNIPEVATPELSKVYSVKLRLKSVNLPKPVEVTIRKEEQLLGSDQVLCLHPLPYKGISHRHCSIISRNMHGHTTYLIRDEGSKNGTRLNDRKLEAGVEYPVQIGDVITLAGRYQFKVVSDAY